MQADELAAFSGGPMKVVFRTAVLSSWLLGVGLLAICLEMHRIRIGHRVHNLLRSRETILERVRRLEVRYNRMVSPDLLLKQVPDTFRPGERFATLGPRDSRG